MLGEKECDFGKSFEGLHTKFSVCVIGSIIVGRRLPYDGDVFDHSRGSCLVRAMCSIIVGETAM
ncbi:hypothetical protein DEO72_LG8g3001 [Vigna unguiculata]|uniref:Uncharacterized protein n=1 Tax=Vigna unguiculata TaxID=3917 RepID=A0A4D6MXS8_VIGUN|nr:hypothetical protein DEO72_LG8g3001 [Vigna unguiculata]